ncbi:unnamed protein product [Euphydryas editha]|uniref:PH domain-containing protein n=1 Tax=Euphydryas editha TaxID=104508 RepID=A0AAU9TSY3_EUPED|nr:unnamed protein product [Euphydryas editha]
MNDTEREEWCKAMEDEFIKSFIPNDHSDTGGRRDRACLGLGARGGAAFVELLALRPYDIWHCKVTNSASPLCSLNISEHADSPIFPSFCISAEIASIDSSTFSSSSKLSVSTISSRS